MVLNKRRLGTEVLPTGFWRAPSKSLRVQVRLTGHDPIVKSFPLFSDTPIERQRQMARATEWVSRTRDSMLGGTHVSTREAEAMTLRDALLAYKADGLTGKQSNVAKDLTALIHRGRQFRCAPASPDFSRALSSGIVAAF